MVHMWSSTPPTAAVLTEVAALWTDHIWVCVERLECSESDVRAPGSCFSSSMAYVRLYVIPACYYLGLVLRRHHSYAYRGREASLSLKHGHFFSQTLYCPTTFMSESPLHKASPVHDVMQRAPNHDVAQLIVTTRLLPAPRNRAHAVGA